MSFTNCLVVMAGGAIGTLMRYLVSLLALPISGQLPWGTIIINITGSLLIGNRCSQATALSGAGA